MRIQRVLAPGCRRVQVKVSGVVVHALVRSGLTRTGTKKIAPSIQTSPPQAARTQPGPRLRCPNASRGAVSGAVSRGNVRHPDRSSPAPTPGFLSGSRQVDVCRTRLRLTLDQESLGLITGGGTAFNSGDNERPPATPRWVLAIGIVAAVLVLLFIIMHVVGGGMRGHMS